MKASAVITQLINRLPQLTNLFTSEYEVSGITSSLLVATATTTTAHGLTVGAAVNIIGATANVGISTLTRAAKVVTVVTSADHDLTLSADDINRGKTVAIAGCNEAIFNGTFVLLSVANRRTVTFSIADTGATSATGSPLVVDGAGAYGYGGLRTVASVVSSTVFTYALAKAVLSPAGGTITARTGYRLSGAASLDRALSAYTEQEIDKLWGFVILDDVTASKNRSVTTDSTDALTRTSYIKQMLVQSFSVFVIAPAADGIAGRVQRDEMEDLAPMLFKSLVGHKFESGLSASEQYITTFISHGFQEYSAAYYVHGFNFETIAVLTFDDSVGYDLDVAFRDIDLSMLVDLGTKEDPLTSSINLDEVEL